MNNKRLVPEAKEGLNKSRIESAMDFSINTKDEYRGNISSRENGLLVKKMIEEYERNLIGK